MLLIRNPRQSILWTRTFPIVGPALFKCRDYSRRSSWFPGMTIPLQVSIACLCVYSALTGSPSWPDESQMPRHVSPKGITTTGTLHHGPDLPVLSKDLFRSRVNSERYLEKILLPFRLISISLLRSICRTQRAISSLGVELAVLFYAGFPPKRTSALCRDLYRSTSAILGIISPLPSRPPMKPASY